MKFGRLARRPKSAQEICDWGSLLITARAFLYGVDWDISRAGTVSWPALALTWPARGSLPSGPCLASAALSGVFYLFFEICFFLMDPK